MVPVTSTMPPAWLVPSIVAVLARVGRALRSWIRGVPPPAMLKVIVLPLPALTVWIAARRVHSGWPEMNRPVLQPWLAFVAARSPVEFTVRVVFGMLAGPLAARPAP